MSKEIAKTETGAVSADESFRLSPVGQALEQFRVCQSMGDVFSKCDIVPAAYQGKPANCAVAIDMALRMGMPPMMVMQNLYVVHGNPAWSSKFLIACVNGCGRFTPLDFETTKETKATDPAFGCRAVAYLKSDTKREHPLVGPWITWKMVNDEGWSKKNGSKWMTMPALMFRYRAAAFWQRLFAPDLSMGIHTADEVADSAAPSVEDTYYTELSSETVMEAAPQVTPERIAEAFNALAGAADRAAVNQLRKDYADVYEADDDFRDNVLAAYEELNNKG